MSTAPADRSTAGTPGPVLPRQPAPAGADEPGPRSPACGPGSSPTQLEYWRDLVLTQAATLKAHDEVIRALIREADSLAPYTGCPEHGAEITALGDECWELEQDQHKADAARGVYAVACNYLQFLRPDSVAKVTPELLAGWVVKVRANAASRLAAPDGREHVEQAPSGRKPFHEMPKPQGWVDERETAPYWQRIAPRQAETIAGHAAELAKWTAKRDEQVARRSRCEEHAGYIEGAVEQRDHVRAKLARTRKALDIFDRWFAALAETAATEVPADLIASAERVGARARRTWNP